MQNRCLNYTKFLNNVIILFIAYQFCINPILKYFEYVHSGLRHNSTLFVIFFAICIVFLFAKKLLSRKYTYVEIYGIYTLLLIIAYQLLMFPFVRSYIINGDEVYLKTISSTIINAFVYAIVGYRLKSFFFDNNFRRLICFLWCCYSLVVLYYTLTNDDGFYLIMNEARIYLMLADTYTILSIFFITSLRSLRLQFLIFLGCLPVLFSLLSRTSLYLFFLVFIIYFFVRKRKYIIILLLSLILACVCVLSYWNIDWDLVIHNRMLKYIFTGEDNSMSDRAILFQKGLLAIKEYWFIGDFMGDVRDNGHTGGYIHNGLSLWRQYGIIPFILLLLLLLGSYLKMLILFFKAKRDSFVDFTFVFATFILLELLTARSFIFTSFWMAIFCILSLYKKNGYRINY